MKKLYGLVLLSLATGSIAQTLDPIIFSTKQEITSSNMTSSHIVYEVDELEAQANTRTADLLRKIPGVEVSQTGLLGGQASVFIRGAEGRHTLILIDGVKVFDPTSIGRTLNLAILNTLDIEKIEVLKGAQSVLYGSDAIGGVVNIITKKGSAKNSIKLSSGYFNEIGTQNTFSVGEGLIYLNAYYQESEFDSEVKDGDEKDKNTSKGFTLNHSVEKGKFEFETMLKMTDTFAEADGNAIDDDRAYGKDKHYFFKEGVIYKVSSRKVINFDISYNKYDRKNKSSYLGKYSTYKYDGSIFETEVRIHDKKSDGSLLYGVNNIKENYVDNSTSELNLSMTDLFIHRNLISDKNSFDIGVRNTNNKDFGSHLIYNLGYKRSLGENQSVRISNKTGYKSPSVYQQQAPEGDSGPIGNEDLSPEKSNNYELSYEYRNNTFLSGVSLFYNEVDQFIGYEYGEGYQNISKVINKGIELSTSIASATDEIGSNLTMINYSSSTGEEIQRRPNFALNVNYSKKLNDKHSFGIDWNWKGRRFENDFSKNTFVLKPYDTFDLNYVFNSNSYKVITSLKNAFDRDYETARGYSVLRKAVEVSFQCDY